MATTTLEGRTLAHATLDTVDIAYDVHLDGCTIRHIEGVINSTTTMRRMTERPTWHSVTCIDPIGIDDDSLPARLSGDCELFALDAPRIARHAGDVYTHLLIYTSTFDTNVDIATDVDGEISVSRGVSSMEMAHQVRDLRARVLAGEIGFARLAWRDESHDLGYIEIERERTDLDPTEGDPHLFWFCENSYVHLGYMEADAEALLSHLDR